MKRFLEWVKSQQLTESRKMYKGWVHPQKNKMEVWEAVAKPWHIQGVVKNPELFGYTKEDLINAIVNSKVRTSRSGTVEDHYRNLVSGGASVDWDIETLLLNDGWVKVTADLSSSADAATDIYAPDVQSARAALKMLERKIPSLPSVQFMIVWTGNDMMRMSRTATIQGEAHYKTFVKTGRIPVMRENLEESFESSYPVVLKQWAGMAGLTRYDAKTKSGLLEIEIYKIYKQGRAYFVDFSVDQSYEVMTQAGEPFKILATVMKAIEMFIDMYAKEYGEPPKSFMFSSNKDDYMDQDSESSRHKVYIRLVKRFAKNFRYSLVSVQDDRATGQMKMALKKD